MLRVLQLPEEILLQIINHLPLVDTAKLLSVNKKLNELVKDDCIWKKFQAENFEDFVKKMRLFPREYQRLILNGSYNFAEYEQLLTLLQLPDNQIENAVKDLKPFNTLKEKHTKLLFSASGIRFLKQYPAQAISMSADYLNIFLWPQTSKLLDEKLLTVNQALNIPLHQLDYMMRQGLYAFQHGLLSIEQAAKMPTHELQIYLDCDLHKALEKKLISVEQALGLPIKHLEILTMLAGLHALENKLINVEQAAAMSLDELKKFIANNVKIEIPNIDHSKPNVSYNHHSHLGLYRALSRSMPKENNNNNFFYSRKFK